MAGNPTKYVCAECGEPIKDGDECLSVREQETNRLVYIAHRACAEDKDDNDLARGQQARY